ncbi:MAG: sugar ABC transporter ATP-binding protein [Halanaerobiaceae bacterium]
MSVPLLKLENITKKYPGVVALDNVCMVVHPGEVIGLVGENGAGKSTLLRIIAGIESSDSGKYFLDEEEVKFKSLLQAQRKGISMVFQEQSLLPNITVGDNVFLGAEDKFKTFGILDKKLMYKESKKFLQMVDAEGVNPEMITEKLGFSRRQMIEIAKSLRIVEESGGNNSIILFDEPTSVLEDEEIKKLFEIIRELKENHAVIFVSHRLDEVLEISDRIYVLKDGENVTDREADQIGESELHNLMVGRNLQKEYYKINQQKEIEYEKKDIVLSVDKLTDNLDNLFRNCTFNLYKGEILGFAGVEGSGKEQLGRALFGLGEMTGDIEFPSGKKVIDSPPDAIEEGIAYIPKERSLEGMVFGFDVHDNINLPNYRNLQDYGVIKYRQAEEISKNWVNRLRIKTPGIHSPCASLSGGNQQKVVLAKWLAINDTKILILDHPTRGIDVGAKEEIYELMREIVEHGLSIILTSDTLEELIGLSNRIKVMKDGEIVKTLLASQGSKPSQEQIVSHMV